MPRNPGNSTATVESVFTHSGRRIIPGAPASSAVFAADLAEHLSKHSMYRGATRGLYTEAQHCAIVAGELAREQGAEAALYGLLHDADRAYSDWPVHAAPLKAAIHRAFGLDWPMPASVAAALARIHAGVELTELRQLCAGCAPEIERLERAGAVPLKSLIRPLGWDRAQDRFVEALRCYAKLALPRDLDVFGGIV